MSGYLALGPMDGNVRATGNGINNNLQRSSDATVDPQVRNSSLTELLRSVKEGSPSGVLEALQHISEKEIDHIFDHPESASVLHVAVKESNIKIVGHLLDAGASPNIRDHGGKKYTALHYAAENGNLELMKLLLSKGAELNAKEGEFGRTCLHILALRWKTNEGDYQGCLQEMLKMKLIKVDSQDGNGVTPLFLAAQKGHEFMIRSLIKKGASIKTKVGLKTVQNLIEKKFPDLLGDIDFTNIEPARRFYGDELYEAMRNRNFCLFRLTMNEIDENDHSSKLSILEEDHGECTLLIYACKHGLCNYADLLLTEGADPTHSDPTTKISPLLSAARNGYFSVMESLTETMQKRGSLEKGLNSCDLKKESALHKVVKREYSPDNDLVDYHKCLQILLNLKKFVNVDAQDEFNQTPLHYAVLSDDQSFVRDLLLSGAHLGIKNKFGTLAITRIQPDVLHSVLNMCVKHSANNITDRDFEIILHYSMLAPANAEYQPETECLKFLSNSKQHRHLLLHPVIDTFLYLKWQRIRRYYFINLALYTAFLSFLTSYILILYGDKGRDEGAFTSNNSSALPNISDEGAGLETRMFLQAGILIFWLLIAVREFVQLFVSWKNYVSSFENWLELAILLMTLSLLWLPLSNVSQQGLSAWLILCSWLEFVLTLGRLPMFSVYITMFTTVSFNFLKFIGMFSSMIIAVSISFFLVFRVDENFGSYPKALLKTIAMSAGEMEYTDLPLSHVPISSHLLFVFFIFLIILVLMNLLNGLAVSDIQLIQKEAEIVSYVSRVKLISHIESVLLGNPFRDVQICDGENGCLRSCGSSYNPVIRLLNYLGKRTLLFHNCLKNHQSITLYPNGDKQRWNVCSCHSFHLKEEQIEAAKSVILGGVDDVADRLARLEDKMDSLTNLIKNQIHVKPAMTE